MTGVDVGGRAREHDAVHQRQQGINIIRTRQGERTGLRMGTGGECAGLLLTQHQKRRGLVGFAVARMENSYGIPAGAHEHHEDEHDEDEHEMDHDDHGIPLYPQPLLSSYSFASSIHIDCNDAFHTDHPEYPYADYLQCLNSSKDYSQCIPNH